MNQGNTDNQGQRTETNGTNQMRMPRGLMRTFAVVAFVVATLLFGVCLLLVTTGDMPVPAGALWLYWTLIGVWYFASIQLWTLRNWALGFSFISILATLVIGLTGLPAILPDMLLPLSILLGLFWFAAWLGVRKNRGQC